MSSINLLEDRPVQPLEKLRSRQHVIMMIRVRVPSEF